MKRILFLVLIAFGAYHWYENNNDLAGSYGEPHQELIMYSLTTCGFCKQKTKELHEQGIAFTEYFIDKDHQRKQELNSKLSKAGLEPKSYGTPIFDVHGVMLPNNPKMSLIKSKLNES